MKAADFTVRRANVDDLPQLGPLLQVTQLPADLEKRFTEFQVVESQGQLVAALGLQIFQKQGKLHSETYLDYALSDSLRPRFWERMKNVAQNHGLIRLWTQETAPFWKQEGFAAVDDSLKDKLPVAFGDQKTPWLSIKLRDDPQAVISLDHEFAVFMESEKARTEEILSHAKMLRGFAYLLAAGLLVFVIVAAIMLLKNKASFKLPFSF